MPYLLEIDVLGGVEVAENIRKMGERAIFAEPAMAEIIPVLVKSEKALWERGRSWTPNAPSTVARKGRNDPLIATGAFKESLTQEGGAHQVKRVGNEELVFGSSVWYAHMATGGGTSKIPFRKVFHLRAQDRVELTEVILKWVLHGEAL